MGGLTPRPAGGGLGLAGSPAPGPLVLPVPVSLSSIRNSASFLCRVLRLIPSRAAALIWTRSQASEDLLDQLALDLADDPVVQVVGVGAGGADALADQLGGQRGEVAAAGADRPGRATPRSCGGRCSTRQLGAVAQDHRPLDVVLQLADVARPVVLAQQPHRLGVDPADLAAVLLGVALQEELDQRRDVLAALAQGRQVDRDDVEPVVQVLAEPAGVDLVEQVAVGGGDDPGVDLDGAGVADPLELPLLQDAEQLDLELGRGAVDLVEEDAAGVRGLEPAGPVVDGAGERPLDVAEQLALEQALGQGAAVDADVGAGVARAEVVDGAGDQLLAGPGLADDQDAGARRGDLAASSGRPRPSPGRCR